MIKQTTRKASIFSIICFSLFLSMELYANTDSNLFTHLPLEKTIKSDTLSYYEESFPNILQIMGDVRDSSSNQLLGDARVILRDSNERILESITTDDFERFDFSLEVKQKYILEVMHYAYKKKRILIYPASMENENGIISHPILMAKLPAWGIVGTIVSEESGEALAQVKINLSSSDGTLVYSDYSNTSGEFQFELKPKQAYKLSFLKEGFYPLHINYSSNGRKAGLVNLNSQDKLSLAKLTVNEYIIIPDIFYESGQWELNSSAITELDILAEFMMLNPEIKIELGSHTDSRGIEKANMELSQKRADTAVEYLISKGIAENRLLARGFGESKIKNACFDGIPCSEEEHRINRRTEIRILPN